jgi:hypothetical protein
MKKLLLVLLTFVLFGCECNSSPNRYTESDQPVLVSWPGGSCKGRLDTYWHDRSYSYKVICQNGPTVYALSNFTVSTGKLPETCTQGDSAWQKQ